jgi:hypothetical protein
MGKLFGFEPGDDKQVIKVAKFSLPPNFADFVQQNADKHLWNNAEVNYTLKLPSF